MYESTALEVMGVPLPEVCEIMRTLAVHDVKDAASLRKLLTAEKRIDIVDSANPRRVLGSLPRPTGLRGSHVRMPCYERMSVFDWEVAQKPVPVSSRMGVVEFTVTPMVNYETVSTATVLATSAGLEHLTKLSGFRLPGETERQAEYRRYA